MANYFRIGSAGLNWSNVGSWSSTSGGTSNGSAQPTSTDNVTFDSNSPATVTVAGTASANTLTLNKASLVITLNGGSLTTSGLVTISTAATINKTASETITASSGITVTAANLTGTAKIILTGGTWTGNTSVFIANDMDIQGNVTFLGGGGAVQWGGGTFTYVSGTVTTTNNTFRINNGTSTFNSAGITWNNLTIFTNTTLTSNVSCTGVLAIQAIVNSTVSETLTSSGGFTPAGAGGTAKVILTGGTWTNGSTNCASSVDLQGNITIGASIRYGDAGTISGTKTLTYVSGTITVTGSTLNFIGNATVNTNGMIWNNVSSATVAPVITLTSNFSMSGLFNPITGFTLNKTTSETLTTSGGMTINGATSGTAKVILTGGTWSGTNTTGIANNLDINGSITISGNVYYLTGTLAYVSGTITSTSSTLNLTGSCTLIGGTYNNITCTNTTGQTYTINTTLVTANGTLTIGTGTATTFAGTSGFTCATLTCATTAATTVTLKNSVTYTVTSALTCFTSRTGSILLFTSDDGTLKATLTLQNGATCNCLASFTRIDASNGRPIDTFEGTLTSCNGILVMTDLVTIAG